MDIALVSPHPVPFGIGGAENLIWGLQDHLAQKTQHRCEIVTLVSPEASLRDVVSSYEAFTSLDLDRFDLVISGKYPAWMINHPNHRVWMLHRLRGLYDTYVAPPRTPGQAPDSPELVAFRRFLSDLQTATVIEPGSIADLFHRFEQLAGKGLPDAIFAYPGPLARQIVHMLDRFALSPHRIDRYAAISKTVRARTGYFPGTVPVDIFYPPASGDKYRCGSDDYFFTCSRLDSAKRVDLIVKAMRHVEADIPLLIGGTGPQSDELKESAGDDPRIRFVGFIPDNALPDYYADALAVPFVPYDEDYGLVTVEAMMSGKPVLTTLDSGGPCEFVIDGETGYATAPEATALGQRMNRLAQDRAKARSMGETARKRVANITWDNVVAGLIDDETGGEKRLYASAVPARRKLTVAVTFPVYPPRGGGQSRVFHLYRNLARHVDIDLVTFGPSNTTWSELEIAPGLSEIRVPKTRRHEDLERDLSRAMQDIPVGDVGMVHLSQLTPEYHSALRYSMSQSQAVIACHPYLLPEIMAATPNQPIWYEAQDVEIDLKSAAFGNLAGGSSLLSIIDRVEGQAWQSSELVFACSRDDLNRLETIYGKTQAHLLDVANGVDIDEITFSPMEARLEARFGTKTALFIGSWHPPNIDAVEQIIAFAAQFPDVNFLVAGTVCMPFRERLAGNNQRPNLRLLGLVNDATRNTLLARCDIALNPMRFGSGTNLKMLDYFAAGIPVVSSAFGKRGLCVDDPEHLIVAPDDDFTKGLERLATIPRSELAAMTMRARELTEKTYSWAGIADRFADEIQGLFARDRSPQGT